MGRGTKIEIVEYDRTQLFILHPVGCVYNRCAGTKPTSYCQVRILKWTL